MPTIGANLPSISHNRRGSRGILNHDARLDALSLNLVHPILHPSLILPRILADIESAQHAAENLLLLLRRHWWQSGDIGYGLGPACLSDVAMSIEADFAAKVGRLAVTCHGSRGSGCCGGAVRRPALVETGC